MNPPYTLAHHNISAFDEKKYDFLDADELVHSRGTKLFRVVSEYLVVLS